MAKNGIDVHGDYQPIIDFNKVKQSGVDFVILHGGYGNAIAYPNQYDKKFADFYSRAKAAGLGVGVYWYSYAQSVAEAKAEAKSCIKILKGKKFEYPIFFDLEESSQFSKGKAFCDSIVEAFCGELERNGYFAGLYISRSPLQTYISPKVAKKYTLWIAEYNSKCNYDGDYGMWQHTSQWRVNGINKNVDHNYCYVDYPKIIKSVGLNGFKKSDVKTTNKAPTKTTAKKSSTAPKKGHMYYTVQRGDTLTSIAKAHNTTVKKLVELNKIKDPDLIFSGHKLKLD